MSICHPICKPVSPTFILGRYKRQRWDSTDLDAEPTLSLFEELPEDVANVVLGFLSLKSVMALSMLSRESRLFAYHYTCGVKLGMRERINETRGELYQRFYKTLGKHMVHRQHEDVKMAASICVADVLVTGQIQSMERVDDTLKAAHFNLQREVERKEKREARKRRQALWPTHPWERLCSVDGCNNCHRRVSPMVTPIGPVCGACENGKDIGHA